MDPEKPNATMITVSLKFRISSLVSEDIIDPLSEKYIGFILPKHFRSKAVSYIFFQIPYSLAMPFVSFT